MQLEPDSAAIVDALLFESPAAAAKTLTLSVPSPAGGGDLTRYAFRIPASAWKK